jgi:hypothetical protein
MVVRHGLWLVGGDSQLPRVHIQSMTLQRTYLRYAQLTREVESPPARSRSTRAETGGRARAVLAARIRAGATPRRPDAEKFRRSECWHRCGENCEACDAFRPISRVTPGPTPREEIFVWSFVKDVRTFTGSLRAVDDERWEVRRHRGQIFEKIALNELLEVLIKRPSICTPIASPT